MYDDWEEAENIRICNNTQFLSDNGLYVSIGAVVVNSHSGNRFEVLDLLHYEAEGFGNKDVYLLKSLEHWNYGETIELETWEIDGVWWYIEMVEPNQRLKGGFNF